MVEILEVTVTSIGLEYDTEVTDAVDHMEMGVCFLLSVHLKRQKSFHIHIELRQSSCYFNRKKWEGKLAGESRAASVSRRALVDGSSISIRSICASLRTSPSSSSC